MHIFFFIFVQFMQFLILDFRLNHYVSEPFNCIFQVLKANCVINNQCFP